MNPTHNRPPAAGSCCRLNATVFHFEKVPGHLYAFMVWSFPSCNLCRIATSYSPEGFEAADGWVRVFVGCHPREIFDGYPWDSFFPICKTFLCRPERFFITAMFLV